MERSMSRGGETEGGGHLGGAVLRDFSIFSLGASK